jgi:hypothetical protein
MKRLTLLFTVALMFAAIPGFCMQTDTAAKPAPLAIKPAPTVVTPAKIPHVTKVFAKELESDSTKNKAYPNNIIMVKLVHPKEFLQTRPAEKSKLMLYANGVELKGVSSDRFSKITNNQFTSPDTAIWIPFQLKRDTSTKDAWDYLYKNTSLLDNELKVSMTLGWEGMFPTKILPNDYPKTIISIVYYNKFFFYVMMGAFLILTCLLASFVVKSDILKEGPKGAYSLAQTQLAYWTILIIGGFIYSLILTDIPSTLNASILKLLGISILTNGTASYIDRFKKQQQTDYTPKESHGFFKDILSDGTSLNMQRFQIFAWNLVLGLYFLYYTVINRTMPNFPDVLLLLAGLSSLSYVSAKPTEPK